MSETVDGQLVEEVGHELATVEAPPATLWRTDDPAEVLKRATDTANALKPVLDGQNMTQNIQGKSHVRVEGWVTLGSMLGVTPVCTWTRRLTEPEKGWEARVEARTLDGRTVGAAEAMCTRGESRWSDAEDYAIRSMAQTRATSKALGSVLRFVVTLAGYSGTPAEEMDGVKRETSRPSDKQVAFVGSLLKKRDDVGASDVPLVESWVREHLTGERGGTCSQTIEILKRDDEQAAKTAARLVEKAREALAQETDVPADTEGLVEDPAPQDEELPFV